MAEVFARSDATGGLANSSMQKPPNSDDERRDEDDFLHSARPSSTENDTGGTSSKGKRSLDDMMDIGGSTRKSTNKKWKDQLIDAMKSVSASMTSKEQRGERSLDDMMDIGGSTRKSTNKKWKDQLIDAMKSVSASMTSKEQRGKAKEEARMMSRAAATRYTMTACIEILKNMSGIPPSAINAAF